MKNITAFVIICLFICVGVSANAKNMEKKKYDFRNKISKTHSLPNIPKHKKNIVVQNLFQCTMATDITVCNNGWCEQSFIFATAPTCEQAGKALDLAIKIMNCPQCFQL